MKATEEECAREPGPRSSVHRAAGPQHSSGFAEAWALWPKNVRGSDKRASQKLWLDLESRFEAKLMIAAERAYLASPDANRKDREGRPHAYVKTMENWLRSGLECWIEQVQATTAPSKQRIDLPNHPPRWRELAALLSRQDPAGWKSYGASACAEETSTGLMITASSTTAADRLRRLVEGLEQRLNFSVEVAGPSRISR